MPKSDVQQQASHVSFRVQEFREAPEHAGIEHFQKPRYDCIRSSLAEQ